MTCVTIDITDLKVTFHPDAEAGMAHAEDNDELFVGKPDDLGELTGPQMVAMYNATAQQINDGTGGNLRTKMLIVAPTKRFPNKEAGIKRLMANITDLFEMEREATRRKPAPKPSAPRRGTGINLAPKDKVYPCRPGTKQAILVDMLSREQGATMGELLEALSGGKKPWQEVTVKSGLSWDMNKVKGYGIRTTKRGDEDCHHLTYPEGMDAPLPHGQKQ